MLPGAADCRYSSATVPRTPRRQGFVWVMSDETSQPAPDSQPPTPTDKATSPSGGNVTLDKLTSAFEQMLRGSTSAAAGAEAAETPPPAAPSSEATPEAPAATAADEPAPTPLGILEAMLFVGHPANEPLTSEQAASLLRGVEANDIDGMVLELNRTYAADGRPYYVMSDGNGYRLVLRQEFAVIREKFYGRIRRARLSRAAVEILAIVAYNQPVEAQDVERLRGHPSRDVLRQLVRRQLLELEVLRDETPRKRLYRTTPRFLRLFQLESLDDLPRHQDLERS